MNAFFYPSKRGINFAKIRGFKVTDYSRALRSRHPCRLQPAPPTLPAATALRRPDSHVGRSVQRCFYSTVCASSRAPSYLASATSRRSPAAAYGLAPYAICVRTQPRLSPSLHPAPNSTGHLMNARFNLGAKFNVITRPREVAEDI